jgi:cytochrome c-type biogenesis protein CcmH/NrfF
MEKVKNIPQFMIARYGKFYLYRVKLWKTLRKAIA